MTLLTLLAATSAQSTFPTAPTPGTKFPRIAVEFSPNGTPFTDGPGFDDVTAVCKSVTITRGRSRETDQFRAGAMTVVEGNADRLFDPEYASGIYSGKLLPRRPWRARAQWAGVNYDLCSQFAESYAQGVTGLADAICTISCADAFKILEGIDIPGSMYSWVVAIDQPTHWWKLNESASSTAAIDSGYGTVTSGIYGGGTLGTTAIVPYDGLQTCYTPGSSYLTLPSSVFPSPPYAIEFWFKNSTPVPASANLSMVSIGDAAGNFWEAVLYDTNGGTISGVGAGGGTVFASSYQGNIPTSGNASDGIAHHVIVNVSAISVATVYIDGAGPWVGTNPIAPFTPTTIRVGQRVNGDAASQFAGAVSNLQIYGAALTATQISDHYNAGKNGLAEATGTRLGRFLNYGGWPTTYRAIDVGNTTIGSFDITAQSLLSYLLLLADTEQGQFYVDRSGKITWRARSALLTATRSVVSQATFGDVGAGELGYVNLVFSYDDQLIRNDVTVQRSGGATVNVTDATSRASFGRMAYSKTGMLYGTDNESLDCANWLLAHYKNPATRIEAMVLKPAGNATTMWPVVLGIEIGDRITVNRRPQGVGSLISKALIVEGIEHVRTQEDHVVTLRLSPAETQSYWVMDDTNLSVMDTSTRVAF